MKYVHALAIVAAMVASHARADGKVESGDALSGTLQILPSPGKVLNVYCTVTVFNGRVVYPNARRVLVTPTGLTVVTKEDGSEDSFNRAVACAFLNEAK